MAGATKKRSRQKQGGLLDMGNSIQQCNWGRPRSSIRGQETAQYHEQGGLLDMITLILVARDAPQQEADSSAILENNREA